MKKREHHDRTLVCGATKGCEASNSLEVCFFFSPLMYNIYILYNVFSSSFTSCFVGVRVIRIYTVCHHCEERFQNTLPVGLLLQD